MINKPSVLVLWGKERSRIIDRWGNTEVTPETLAAFLEEYPDADPLVHHYEFETEAECTSFMDGASEAEGWEGYHVISDDVQLGLIRKLIEAHCKKYPEDADSYRDHMPTTVKQQDDEVWDFEDGDLD